MIVILISGNKRAGKDAVGSMLNQLLSNSEKFSFAEPMKNIISTTFNINIDELEDFKNSENYSNLIHQDGSKQTYREILQRFGTEAMKSEFGDDVWGKLMLKKIKGSSADVAIITDFRFQREYDIISDKYKTLTINVIRKSDKLFDTHSSENSLNNFEFDEFIINDGSINELFESVKTIDLEF